MCQFYHSTIQTWKKNWPGPATTLPQLSPSFISSLQHQQAHWKSCRYCAAAERIQWQLEAPQGYGDSNENTVRTRPSVSSLGLTQHGSQEEPCQVQSHTSSWLDTTNKGQKPGFKNTWRDNPIPGKSQTCYVIHSPILPKKLLCGKLSGYSKETSPLN